MPYTFCVSENNWYNLLAAGDVAAESQLQERFLCMPINQSKGVIILITNKTVDKKSSHNPYMQDYARFFVQFLIGS